MRHRNLITIGIVLSLLFMSYCSFGQRDIRKADKQLELKAYDLAIKNYKTYLETNPDNAYAQVKLAEAYRRTNDLLKAIIWYEKALSSQDDLDAVYRLNYAQSLKKIGLYEKAKNWYSEYSQIDDAIAQEHLNGCDLAIELLKEDDQYNIAPFEGNSDKSDFGLSKFGDKFVFSSFREDIKRSYEKQNISYIQNAGNQLFSVQDKEMISALDIQFLRPEFKEIYWLGPMSYSGDMKRVAYTKNNFSDGAIQVVNDESDLSIYLATVENNGDFVNERPFPFNEVEFSYAFPNLAFNGSALYFSSNRLGGLGGFDIYVSYLKDNEWSKPENLGPTINSAYNEITPYYDEDRLYFSSDMPSGLGGFDAYTTSVNNGKWGESSNLGKGINSPADDYYLIGSDNEFFYLTSNRLGGSGKDDIYFASRRSENDEIALSNVESPEALQLDELAAAKLEIETETLKTQMGAVQKQVEVSQEDEVTRFNNKKKDHVLNNSENFKLYDHYELELRGAKKAGTTDVVDPSATRYFIQVASLSMSKGEVSDFHKLSSLGKVYRFYTTSSTKIRLGSFESKIDADMALAKVRKAGYSDAFITSAVLSVANYELLTESQANSVFNSDSYDESAKYKVRLASYSDPLWFDTNELEYLDGELEQWTKGYWTIFILSGFDSVEEAESARIKAVNRGFKEAEVVIDDRGVLKRVNRN